MSYQQPYDKVIRTNGEIVPPNDHNKQEEQLEALTDIIGPWNIGVNGTIGAMVLAERIVPNQESITTQNVSGGSPDTILSATLTNAPIGAASVQLFLNGIYLAQGVGKKYRISGIDGREIVWLTTSGTAPALNTTDELMACYLSLTGS